MKHNIYYETLEVVYFLMLVFAGYLVFYDLIPSSKLSLSDKGLPRVS
jgi:hypothetical protein